MSWALSKFHEERERQTPSLDARVPVCPGCCRCSMKRRGTLTRPDTNEVVATCPSARCLHPSSPRLGGQMVGLLCCLSWSAPPRSTQSCPCMHRDSLGKARDERGNWEISHGSPKFLSHLAEFTCRRGYMSRCTRSDKRRIKISPFSPRPFGLRAQIRHVNFPDAATSVRQPAAGPIWQLARRSNVGATMP